MTHYYLYIAAGSSITPDSDFFKVGIGSSKQSDRDLLFLIAHAADNGHYFKLWSHEVDEFLSKIRLSLNDNCRQMRLVSARELVRAFKSGTAISLNQSQLSAADQQRKFLDLNYRIISNLNRNSSGENGSAKGNS